MSDTLAIVSPFTKHKNRMRRDLQNTKSTSDRQNETRQSQQQASPRKVVQHMSEPCQCPTSLEETGTNGDMRGVSPTVETGKQQYSPRERASVHSLALYRAAKAIYNSGPEGEGQEVWNVWKKYQQARKEQKDSNKMAERKPSVRGKVVSGGEEVPVQAQHIRTLVPHHAPPRPPRSPRLVTAQSELDETEKMGAKGHKREDSGVSPSSIEIPVTIGDCIQRAIETNKPLPAVPRPEPTPKTHETAFPAAPASPPLIVKPPGRTYSLTLKRRSEPKSDHTWWKKRQSPNAQAELKSKISHPIPIMASYEGLITNMAVECGGVGGPAVAISLPITRSDAAQLQSQSRNAMSTTTPEQRDMRKLPSLLLRIPSRGPNRMKSAPHMEDRDKVVVQDDMQPTHWSDSLVGPAYEAGKSIKQSAKDKLDGVHAGRRRRCSDASFECQGVADGGLDRYQVSEMEKPSRSSGKDDESLELGPLFSGRIGRGTYFYQPYIDILDEY